jgi:hypothetical protein
MKQKYKTLTTIFWRGSPHGQIQSVWATRQTRLDKFEDFKSAIAAGDLVFDAADLSPIDRRHLADLGIDAPEPPEPGYIKEITHDGYGQWDRGQEQNHNGQHNDYGSLTSAMTTIRTALQETNLLEQLFQEKYPEVFFNYHYIIRAAEREHCKFLNEALNRELPNWGLVGQGWGSSTIYDGSEESLFNKNDKPHAFLRTHSLPELNGRCDADSKRILIVRDMALRGLNCWPLTVVIDLVKGGSVNVQVQILGRPVRWPFRLKHFVDDPLFEQFCHPRWYTPATGPESATRPAWEFIRDMRGSITTSGIHDWGDLIRGVNFSTDTSPGNISGSSFTFLDWADLDSLLLQHLTSHGEAPGTA